MFLYIITKLPNKKVLHSIYNDYKYIMYYKYIIHLVTIVCFSSGIKPTDDN